MQLPTTNTPVARCEVLSLYTQGALRTYPTVIETPPDIPARLESLAQSLEAATTALMTAQAEYRTTILALIPLRFGVRMIDLKADNVVRSVKRAADDAHRSDAACRWAATRSRTTSGARSAIPDQVARTVCANSDRSSKSNDGSAGVYEAAAPRRSSIVTVTRRLAGSRVGSGGSHHRSAECAQSVGYTTVETKS